MSSKTTPDFAYQHFLADQGRKLQELSAATGRLHVTPDPRMELPNSWLVAFDCRTLTRSAGGSIEVTEGCAVHVVLPSDYLARVDTLEVLRWVGPTNPFHPNIHPEQPVLCVGYLYPAMSLVELIFQVYSVVTWQNVTLVESDALNQDACVWARSNRDRFPVDPRPLRASRLKASVRAAEGESMKAIAQALERHTDGVTFARGDAWECTLQNGVPFPCSVRVDGDWLVLTSAPPRLLVLETAWSALETNDRVDGEGPAPAGIVLDGSGAQRLRFDVHLPSLDPAALDRRVGAACDGLTRTLAGNAERDPATPDPAEAAEAVAERVVEAGWPVECRDESVYVNLPGSRRSHRATCVGRADGGISATVELVDRPVTSPLCREALAVHMLAAAGAVRLVHAAAMTDGDHLRSRFAVRLPAEATAMEIEHGLGALAVACDQCGTDCTPLASDAWLAERYLLARGRAVPVDRARP